MMIAVAPLLLAFAGPPLQLPWKCGKVEACTQGHGTGSHTGNSKWAWDFVLSEGEEIWAASAGIVTHRRMSSTVGGCNSAYITEGNYITIDHGDGTSIIYAHMQANSSPLKVGDPVEVGDLVARVGQTGYSCGAHLHMAVQEDCGGSHCASVHASFAGIGDPTGGQSHESDNCPVCTRVLDGGVTKIDDQHAGCLVRKTKQWSSANNGHAGHHFYTFATDEAEDFTRAYWIFGVDVPGQYEVEVFIPEQSASSRSARYEVRHAEGKWEVVLDQSTDKGWQSLGIHPFVGGEGERIYLGDATGESAELKRRVAFDAIRMTYVGPLAPEPEPEPEPPPPPEPGDSSGGTWGGEDGSSDGTTSLGVHADPVEDTDGSALPGWSEDADAGGCRVGGDAVPPGWWWLWLLPGLLRRRALARRR